MDYSYETKTFNKIKNGVTDVVFEIKLFKRTLAAILKVIVAIATTVTHFFVTVSYYQNTVLYQKFGFSLLTKYQCTRFWV